MRNAELEEAQAGIKIAGRNTNNLRYAEDNTLMAESEEELNHPFSFKFIINQWCCASSIKGILISFCPYISKKD